MVTVKYLKMVCYGRYNSFRISKVAMQEITDMFAYVFRIVTHKSISPCHN